MDALHHRIYKDFYYLAENAGITNFLHDQCDQYILLTNTSVQNFHFHARRSPPAVEFYLYDEYKEMLLYEFCEVCKLPFEDNIEEPRPCDVGDFMNEITIGEGERCRQQEHLVYIFLSCATTQYFLVDV